MKKLLLGLGSIAAIAAPIIAVVSCSKKNDGKVTNIVVSTSSNPMTFMGTHGVGVASLPTAVTGVTFTFKSNSKHTGLSIDDSVIVMATAQTGYTVNGGATAELMFTVKNLTSAGIFEGFKILLENIIKYKTETYPKPILVGEGIEDKVKIAFKKLLDTIYDEHPDENKVYTSKLFSDKIKELSLPAITSIGKSGLRKLTSLTKLTLASAETVGVSAVAFSPLTTLIAPLLRIVKGWAFANSLLKTLDLPEAIEIGRNAFGSSPLTSLTLPKVVSIAMNAFNYSQMPSLDLPNVETIEWRAFDNNRTMTTLTMPKVKTIGEGAFGETKLTKLSIPTATTIGTTAFEKSPLTSLDISGATSVGINAFAGIVNASTTHVTLPNSLNTDDMKNSIFGAGHWSNITFTAQ